MNINDIRFPSEELKAFIISHLNSPGPWQLKVDLKSKLNCLIHYLLSGCSAQALHVREYLCNEDPDSIWIESLEQRVLPYLQQFIHVNEVSYG